MYCNGRYSKQKIDNVAIYFLGLNIVLQVAIIALSHCNIAYADGVKMTAYMMNNNYKKKWQSLTSKKIFFAHQSVGFDIIDGIKNVTTGATGKFNIVELKNISPLTAPGFYHSRVGKNTDPISKIDDFVRQMDEGIGNSADIAFFKLCFVDIRPETDIKKVFSHYTKTMVVLKKKYPQTKFVHLTVPLNTTIVTWKTKVKVMLKKKEIWEYDGNVRKNEYNALLRHQYAGKEPIFDLAYYESLYPDQSRASFFLNGQTFYDLAPEYTYDDGHLNEKGRQWVAEHLLNFLAEL